MKKYPRPPSSNRWDQFEKLTTDNNEVIEMLLRDKELKAIYSKVGNIPYLHLHHLHIFIYIIIKARVQKPYPIYDYNGQNRIKLVHYL